MAKNPSTGQKTPTSGIYKPTNGGRRSPSQRATLSRRLRGRRPATSWSVRPSDGVSPVTNDSFVTGLRLDSDPSSVKSNCNSLLCSARAVGQRKIVESLSHLGTMSKTA